MKTNLAKKVFSLVNLEAGKDCAVFLETQTNLVDKTNALPVRQLAGPAGIVICSVSVVGYCRYHRGIIRHPKINFNHDISSLIHENINPTTEI